jgi:hypothetical protein
MKRPSVDRFAGCLLGQSLADAVGQLFNGFPGELCQEFSRSTLFNWWHGFEQRQSPATLRVSQGAWSRSWRNKVLTQRTSPTA